MGEAASSLPEGAFRIHPALGIARVGNSKEYYLGPETMAGFPVQGQNGLTGGLPIRPGTEAEVITSRELRDRNGGLKRQAARFRIFHYRGDEVDQYPCGGGSEVTVGGRVGDRIVADIIWTVHLANKKAAFYVLNDDLGMALYEHGNRSKLTLRNLSEGADPHNPARLRKLIIDAGPRAIRGTDASGVAFDKASPASFWQHGAEISTLNAYPKSFPDLSFAGLYSPAGPIDTLGQLETDAKGRLIVTGGFGKACGWLRADGTPTPLTGGLIAEGVYGDVNADGWFDDTSDGPVSATLVFDDGSVAIAHGAWVTCTDPSYAPQILNTVSLWDEVFDTWVRQLDLRPEIYTARFQDDYQPLFADEIQAIFHATALQRWTTNLPDRAIEAHDAVGAIKAADEPGETILTGLAFIRDPNSDDLFSIGPPLMPLSMGDAGQSFMSVTLTQYFFLDQWNKGLFRRDAAQRLGQGEFLDKAVMVNCLGGRFCPGIDMTFIVRDPEIYETDWRATGSGPFRLRRRAFDYAQAQYSQPLLTLGYVPLHPGPDGVMSAPLEPGDASKFMAVPWHVDYNSCATHNPAPNPLNTSTLYWSWPAQRPVAVHAAADVVAGKLGPQRYSIRGKGTATDDLGNAGRYQELIDIVLNWHRIGFIVQGCAITGSTPFSPEQYLEVESRLDETEIRPWPMNATVIGS